VSRSVNVGIVTREYPPFVYGGAGVHVANLVRYLKEHVGVAVHCFGDPRDASEVAATYQPWKALSGPEPHAAALEAMSVDLAVAKRLAGVDLVHTHTWYANMAGHWAKLLYRIPHVLTSHSLEPLRPWKSEQLGGGYALSRFCEHVAIESADAVIAVSEAMRVDILSAYPNVAPDRVEVIYNGIDPEQVKPEDATDELSRHGIEPTRPYAVFVGRLTRQKGIIHLLEAAEHLVPGTQLVLCAGEADTEDLLRKVEKQVAKLRETRGHVVWIPSMLSRRALSQVLSHARVFVCPSVYEPFGIVNLEAMACAVPVVASAVGGIPEIVADGQTGTLVPFEDDGGPYGTPKDCAVFARNLANAINLYLEDRDRATRAGSLGRERVLERFSWALIAEQTAALYRKLTARR